MHENDHEKLTAALFGKRDVVKVKGHVGDPFRGYVLLGPTLRKFRDLNNSLVSVYWWQPAHFVSQSLLWYEMTKYSKELHSISNVRSILVLAVIHDDLEEGSIKKLLRMERWPWIGFNIVEHQ